METVGSTAFLTRVSSTYWLIAQREVARLLSWQDREPVSRTYGCFDRTYWGWKFTDFAGARFQEGIYALAFLFSRPLEGHLFYRQPDLLTWVRAGMRFWQQLQNADGSFDEAYPFEHSLAATAFTSFYVGEGFLLLKDNLPANEQALLHETFTRAGNWLCRNDERHGTLSNHLAAAAAALYVIFRITGEARFEQRCWYFVQRIYDHQSSEGWYEEYGGADPGYQTHCTFYLARLWQHTKDVTLLESLRRSVNFLKCFIHLNGTLGGEYGSRNTEFYFPGGFEILAATLSDAAQIAHFMREPIVEQTMVGLSTVDAYNFLPMLNSYLFAADNAIDLDGAIVSLPCQQIGEWSFPDAGLVVKSTPTYYAVLGLSKGGVLKLYDRTTQRLVLSDCGYWATLPRNKVVSSQSLSRLPIWQHLTDVISIESDFVEVNQRVQTCSLFIGFRLFSLTLGRIPAAAYWLKSLLVNALVRRRRPVKLRLHRRVHLARASIQILDEITSLGKLSVLTLRRGWKFSTIHMGSSRYFQAQELDTNATSEEDWATELQKRGRVFLRWEVRLAEDPEVAGAVNASLTRGEFSSAEQVSKVTP